MFKFCNLYSGSSGNCSFVGTDNINILIDCGESQKKIKDALESIGQDISKIDAIIVTHEHSDHIKNLGAISKKYDIPVQACAEEYDFSSFGIKKEACISEEYVKKITGYNIVKNTKRSNRKYCTCIPSIDVGEYNTCPNLCAYCYANYNEKEVLNRYKLHNKTSPVLTGNIVATDIIKLRKDVGYKKYNLNI